MWMAASRGLSLERVRKRGLQMIKQGMKFTILICPACGPLAQGIEPWNICRDGTSLMQDAHRESAKHSSSGVWPS